jgi:CAAX prenyl protease-like protein
MFSTVTGARSATVLSIALTALLFGVLHSSILAAALAGALYGWLRHASGSLMAPMIAHAVTNFLISMYVLTSGNWSYW